MAREIQIFVASASDVKDERDCCNNLISSVNSNHKHLHLKSFLWEYNFGAGNNPGIETVQDGINPNLVNSHICFFIFYSRIGINTLTEFNLALEKNIKVFAFFKKGFSPETEIEIDNWKALIAFKNSMNNSVLKNEYTLTENFEAMFKEQLNFYLSEKYPAVVELTNEEVIKLKIALGEKQLEIDNLKKQPNALPDIETKNKLELLQTELLQLRETISQSSIAQKESEVKIAELEKLIGAEKEHDEKKQAALKAIEEKDFDKADNLYEDLILNKAKEFADDFYQRGIIKELKYEFAEALRHFEFAANFPPGNFNHLMKAGELNLMYGHLDNAIDYYTKALSLVLKNNAHENPDVANCYNNIGLGWQAKGNLNKAIENYAKALAIYLKLFGEENPNVATLYNNIGMTSMAEGNLNKAIEYLEKALKIDLKLFGEENSDVATLYNNLGMTWKDKGNLDKAIEYLEYALKIDLKLFGEENPNVAIRYNNLGSTWQDKGNPDKAIEYLEKALNIDLKLFGEENPNVTRDYSNLGLALQAKGNLNKAIEFFEKALNIDLKLFGEENPKLSIRFNNFGLALQAKGNLDNAIDYFVKALKIDLKLLGEENPKVAIDYNILGLAWQDKGNLGKAIEYYEKAYPIFLKTYGADNPTTQKVKANLDDALNEKDKAR